MPCGLFGNITIGPLTPDVIDSITNPLGPYLLTLTNSSGVPSSLLLYSNLYNQGVFVYTGTNNVAGQIRFLPTFNLSNGFDIVAIQLATVLTNTISNQGELNAIYFVDSFGASTNHGLAVDTIINPYSLCNDPNYRPAAYVVSRTVPPEFSNGFSPGLGVPPPIFFYDPASFSNAVVRGGSAADYSFTIDNVAAQAPNAGSVSNLPGRIRIYANNLNLNQAHLRAEGQIVVQATNLVTSVNAIMDCQNLSYNLGATNGSLYFTNLALPSVQRMNGTCAMWTGVWSNYMTTLYLNYAPSNVVTSTSTNTIWVESDITNITLVNLSITVVDASGIQTIVPVMVQDLILHGSNIVVSDPMTVDRSFLLDGPSATLLKDLTLTGSLQNWTSANAPTLRNFTNNGILSIPSGAHFGDDGTTNYLAFVNNGQIFAGEQTINSVNLQVNSGGLNFSTSAGFVGIAQTVQLTGAIVEAVSDMQFFANNFQLGGLSTIATGGALYLTVTNSLADGGVGSGNSILCQNGFNLLRKPLKGDLLGTAVSSYAPAKCRG